MSHKGPRYLCCACPHLGSTGWVWDPLPIHPSDSSRDPGPWGTDGRGDGAPGEQEAVPEQESGVRLAGSEAGPPDPHILQQPQVRDLVATVVLVQPGSHLVLIGFDAADIEGLLPQWRTLRDTNVSLSGRRAGVQVSLPAGGPGKRLLQGEGEAEGPGQEVAGWPGALLACRGQTESPDVLWLIGLWCPLAAPLPLGPKLRKKLVLPSCPVSPAHPLPAQEAGRTGEGWLKSRIYSSFSPAQDILICTVVGSSWLGWGCGWGCSSQQTGNEHHLPCDVQRRWGPSLPARHR